MTLLSDWVMVRMMIELPPKVNRAFSANKIFFTSPEALPQAGYECCAFGAKTNG
jgi:hypothetical protein